MKIEGSERECVLVDVVSRGKAKLKLRCRLFDEDKDSLVTVAPSSLVAQSFGRASQTQVEAAEKALERASLRRLDRHKDPYVQRKICKSLISTVSCRQEENDKENVPPPPPPQPPQTRQAAQAEI